MKRRVLVGVVSVVAFVCASVLFAEDVEKPKGDSNTAAIAKQIGAIRDLCDRRDDNGRYVLGNSRSSFLRYLSNAERHLEQKQFPAFKNALESAASYANDDTIRKAVQKLQDAADDVVQAETKALVDAAKTFVDGLPTRLETVSSDKEMEKIEEELNGHVTYFNNMYSSVSAEIQGLRNKLQQVQGFVREWAGLVGAESDGDPAKALEIVTRLQSNSYQYRIVSRKSLQKKADALSEAVNKSVAGEMEDIQQALSKAKTYKEAQDASAKFNSFYQKISRVMYNHPIRQDMENSRQALTYWLNALASEENGDFQAALQAMQSLESSGYRYASLLDRSMVAAKKKTLMEKALSLEASSSDPMIKMVDDIISKAKTTEELCSLGAKLQTLMNSSYNSSGGRQEVSYLAADLQQLAAAQSAMQSRQLGQLFQYPQTTAQYAHRWKAVLAKHYQAICAKAIASLCQVDELKPSKEGQGIDEAVLALADKAVEQKDWDKVHLYLDTYRMAFFAYGQQPAWLTSEIAASKAFIAGRNFEKADQPAHAAAQYMVVLQCTGKRVPSDEATRRLRDLKEKYPEIMKSVSAPAIPVEAGTPYPIRSMPMGLPMHGRSHMPLVVDD